jgi:RNA polymerase sigma-70 factor (ECF subfamily)
MADKQKEYTDRELMELFRQEGRKEHAFNLIVLKYQQKLYWHIRKLLIDHNDSDDVLQNVFIKVWGALDTFREDATLYTWLYRIATNEALTFMSNRKRRFFLPLGDVEKKLASSLENDPYFNGDELQLKLQKAILTLPEKQRLVFNMKYFDEMKYEEMSEILETSVGALKASFHHAVKKIENYISEH